MRKIKKRMVARVALLDRGRADTDTSGSLQRLLILCGNPPLKAAGSFLCYRGAVQLIGLFLAALLLAVALVGLML